MAQRSCFLSYGRKDDEPFVETLRDYLCRHGVKVWWDRESMEARGAPFLRMIDEAIRGVDRVVLVVGPEALASRYVRQELEVAEETCKVVVKVLRSSDAETAEATLQREHVYDARGVDLSRLTKSQQRVFDGLVGELTSAPTEPAYLSGVPALPERLDRRPEAVAALVDGLLADASGPIVVSAGMGGIGKSVLAALVARSCAIRRAFKGVLFTRREQDDAPLPIINDLLRLAKEPLPASGSLDDSVKALSALLTRTPYLVVVDNIWNGKQVTPVAQAAYGSPARVLLTSRVQGVAAGLKHRLVKPKLLSQAESRAHLASWVGTTVDQLPPEADVVVERCGGLLLALSLCGAFMTHEHNTWGDLALSLSRFELSPLSLDLQNYAHPGVIAAMDASVNALQVRSPALAARYRTLATFGTGRPVPLEMVAAVWQLDGEKDLSSARHDLHELHEDSLLTLMPSGEHVLHDIQRAFLLSTGPNESTLRAHFLSRFEASEGLLAASGRRDWLRQVMAEYLLTSNGWGRLSTLFAVETDAHENAWFSLRVSHDELDEYLGDWTRIARDCARLEPVQQIRWLTDAALTRASVANRATNTPWQLVCAAVRHQLWTPRRARGAFRLMPPQDGALGLAGLLKFESEANRERVLQEFLDTVARCDARQMVYALEQLRLACGSSGGEWVRPQVLEFIRSRPDLTPGALEQLVGFLKAEDLGGLTKALTPPPDSSAVLTRLMTPDAARTRLRALGAGADITTLLSLWRFACFDRELLSGNDLHDLVCDALIDQSTVNTPYLMRLLKVASEPSREDVATVLTGEAWARMLAHQSPVGAKHLLEGVASPALIRGLRDFMRLDRDDGWRARGLATLAAVASGRQKTELLLDIEAGIANDLRRSEERGDFSGLPDLMGDFARIWSDLLPTTRANLLARIPSISRSHRAGALAPLFAVEPETATRLGRELLESLRYVQAWYEVRDPIAALAPHLPWSEVELALTLTEAGRDAGFESSHASVLWNQLNDGDRARAYSWFLDQTEEHLNAPGAANDWQAAERLYALSAQLAVSPEVLARARHLSLRIRDPEHAAVCRAALAAAGGPDAEEDWEAAARACERIEIAGSRGQAYAKLATLAASGSREARFRDEALKIEAGLAEQVGARGSWPWRARIIVELPDSPLTSERAIKMLDEVYGDKLDSYAPELLPKCDISALLGEGDRLMSRGGTGTVRAVVRRLAQGGEFSTALQAARLHGFPAETIDDLSPRLSLEQTRELLARGARPALVERLARLDGLREALNATKELHGVERYVAIARACKHGPTPAIVEPLLGALSDLEASDSLRGALAAAAEVWPRLPHPARLFACRTALDLIGSLPRQIAIPAVYLLSPVLVSFQPDAPQQQAASILDSVLRATRWWPVYPRTPHDGSRGAPSRHPH